MIELKMKNWKGQKVKLWVKSKQTKGNAWIEMCASISQHFFLMEPDIKDQF